MQGAMLRARNIARSNSKSMLGARNNVRINAKSMLGAMLEANKINKTPSSLGPFV